MNRRFTMDEYATMGLDAITTGASSVEDRIQSLDDEVHEHDGAVTKWGLTTYGPGGVMKAAPDDHNTVAQEQTYQHGWSAFFDDWVAVEWASRRRKELADMKSDLDGGASYEELSRKLAPSLDKKKAEFDGLVARFDRIKAAHGKKQIEGVAGEAFPWMKVLMAVAAIGVIGGTCWYLKTKSDEAKAEALKAGTDGARGLRPPRMGDDDQAPPAPSGGALMPPEPLPHLELRATNGKTLVSGRA